MVVRVPISRRGPVALVAVAAMACGQPCERPLSDYCRGPCPELGPAWMARAADVEEERVDASARYVCGDATVVTYTDRFFGGTERFDATGTLVGATFFTDEPQCGDGALVESYGSVPACTPTCREGCLPADGCGVHRSPAGDWIDIATLPACDASSTL